MIAIKKDLLQTIGYFAAFIILGIVMAITGPSLPSLAGNTRTQLDTISIIFITRSIGYLTGILMGGRLVDSLPGHIVLAMAVGVMGVLLMIIPLVSILWLLGLAFLVMGVADGFLDVGGNTLLVWVHRSKSGPYMNGLHFFFGAGAIISPLVIAWSLANYGSLHQSFWLLALLTVPVVIWLLRTPSPRMQPAKEVKKGGKTSIGFLVILMTLMFFYVGVEMGFGGWLYIYAVETGISSEAGAAQLTSVFFTAFTVGRLLGIPVAVRLQPRTMILIDLFGCVASVSVLLIWQQSIAALWAGVIGLGFSMASFVPALLSFISQHTEMTGKIISQVFAGGSLGTMLLPWLIGQFFVSYGPVAFLVLVFVEIILTFIFFMIFQYTMQRTTSAGREI